MIYAIVVAQFNKEITDGLLKGALRAFKKAGIKSSQLKIVPVPGAWEIPLAAHALAQTKKYVAIITLGAVIKGATTHDYWINQAIFPALQRVARAYLVPVTLGIITCNTWKQAVARSSNNKENRGFCAASAAFAMVKTLSEVSQ